MYCIRIIHWSCQLSIKVVRIEAASWFDVSWKPGTCLVSWNNNLLPTHDCNTVWWMTMYFTVSWHHSVSDCGPYCGPRFINHTQVCDYYRLLVCDLLVFLYAKISLLLSSYNIRSLWHIHIVISYKRLFKEIYSALEKSLIRNYNMYVS